MDRDLSWKTWQWSWGNEPRDCCTTWRTLEARSCAAESFRRTETAFLPTSQSAAFRLHWMTPLDEKHEVKPLYSHPSYTDQDTEESESQASKGQLQGWILTAVLEFVPTQNWRKDAITERANIHPASTCLQLWWIIFGTMSEIIPPK